MNISRVVRREAGAAWRSMRYDLGRQPRSGGGTEHPQYDAYLRRPRRIRTALVAAAVAAGGAAATYLGVTGGLSTLTGEDGNPPGGLPAASSDGSQTGPADGLPGAARATGTAAQPSWSTGSPTQTPSAHPGAGWPARGGSEADATGTPPVPTPAPQPTCSCPNPDPTSTASPSPRPSSSESPTATPTPSATPGP